jgi:hypothetical protein
MLRSALVTALFAAAITAQSTISLFLLDTDPQTLVASVISSDASATEYLVGCPTGIDANDCGYNPPVTVKHAGDVYAASLTAAEEQFTMSWECTVATTGGICTTSAGGSQANFPGQATSTLAASDVTFFPVTIAAVASTAATATISGAGSVQSVSKSASGVAAAATKNSAPLPTAGVGMGLAGLAAVAMVL